MCDECEIEEINPLVIDAGSFTIKAGFSGDEGPRSICRSIVGRYDTQGKRVSPSCIPQPQPSTQAPRQNLALLSLTTTFFR